MQEAAVVLSILRERGRKGLPLTQLYRQMFNKNLYLLAYGNIYSNQGAMTPGTSEETADGMSEGKIDQIVELMRYERYRFSPARRIYIPKKNGKLRPLGLPSWSDKLVGEVVRLLLEAYYEPRFSDRSHGFRKGLGCHTALREIRNTWVGTVWFIEGDISDCFGSLDHQILLSILSEKIHDQRFLRLIRHMLKAGYLEDWEYHDTLSGCPQGGVVSPVLSNIYLNKLDEFVERELIPRYTRGASRARNPEYMRIKSRRDSARRRGDRAPVRDLKRQMRTLPSVDPIKAKIVPYRRRGKPWHRPGLQNMDDYDIVRIYGAEYRGIVNYYLLAQDVWRLSTLCWYAQTSMLKTLAAKHKSSVAKMAARHKAKVITGHGPRTCFEARLQREGKKDLVARYGGIPLKQDRRAVIHDPAPAWNGYPRKELIHRLRKRVCELCEHGATVTVHQIAALKQLGRPGPGQPAWAALMARMRRKTLIVCAPCHDWIHANPVAHAA
jgi:retron-type reverse transcriptase